MTIQTCHGSLAKVSKLNYLKMEKNKKNILINIAEVLASNVATIIAGIVLGFIIPKVLTVDGFGYYKTFTLYATYTGLFSLGIIDGIVLEYGGCDYHEYDRRLFRSIFRWYAFIHIIWAVIILGFSILFHDSNYSYIAIMIAIYMFFANFVGYFQQISQITQRFKEYSIAKIIQSLMRIVSGLIMIALFLITGDFVDYRIYIGLTVLEFVIVSIGYYLIYSDIIRGSYTPLAETKETLISLSRIGFPLLFANLCSTLILSLDRQFVNLLFSNKEYAVYAFAYNLLALVTVATSAISTVLYPMLKRTTKETLKENYSDLIGIMLVLVYGTLAAYFPLCKFIRWFLPNYIDSLVIFRIIFPGLAISSAVTVVMHNYYKTLGDNYRYFIRSIVVLIISAIANLIAYLCFHTTISISIASIITMIIWYVYVEQYFVLNYKYDRRKNLGYLIVMMIAFYLVTIMENWIISLLLYLLVFSLITVVMQKNIIINAKKILKKTS